jgi:hypothetical protein
MPTPTYEKSFYFEKSVDVSAESMAFLLDALAKLNLGLVLKHGKFDLGDGVFHIFDGPDDFRSTSSEIFSKSKSLTLWVDSKKIRCVVDFKIAEAEVDVGYRLPSSFSYVLVFSEEQMYLVFIKGVIELFVTRFTVSGPPREGMFIALGNDIITGHEIQSAPNQLLASTSRVLPTLRQRLLEHWKISGVVTLLTLLIAYLGLRASTRQADTGESQLDLERQAQFTVQRLTNPENQNDQRLKDWRLTNLGRGPATNVSVFCGSQAEHGPKGDLGTIGPNVPRDFHFSVDIDERNVNHRQDILCIDSFYITYKDGIGPHTVTFDSAGNAKPVN